MKQRELLPGLQKRSLLESGALAGVGDSPVTAISPDKRARSRCGSIVVAPSPGVPRGALSIMGCGEGGGGWGDKGGGAL